MACPSESLHTRFAGGRLSQTLQLEFAEHLDICPDCRERSRLLRRDAPHSRTLEAFSERERRAEDLTRAEFAEPTPDFTLLESTTADRQSASSPPADMYRLLSAERTDDVAGIRLGRFVIQRWLGVGGFGIVFLAHDDLLRRDVALKLPQARALARPEVRERFLREAEAAAQLYHPNVVPVFEAGEEEGICYIASGFCSGPTLDGWLAAQPAPVSVEVAVSLVRQLARAVEHAHSQRVLHRDIKPSNILLEPSPASAFGYTPKLTDFGLAKIIDGDTQMTGDDCMLGTPRYMAPEQAVSKWGPIGPATDVFALGAVLYEALTGVAPYAGEDYAQTLHRLLYERPTPPRSLRPDVPRDLEAIVLKCIEKRAVDRYRTARELAEDLRRFQEGHATSARPIGRLESLRRWTVRQPAMAALLVVIGVAVLSLMGILLAYNRSLQEFNRSSEKALALTTKARLEGDAHRIRLGGMLFVSKIQLAHKAIEEHDLVQASRLLVDIRDQTPDLTSDFIWRYLWNQLTPQGREIESCGAAIYDMAISSDGSRLAATGADGRLRIYDGVTFAPLVTVPTEQGETNSVVFSPDGRRIATAGDNGTVRIWDVETATPQRSIRVSETLVFDAVFSLDGQTLITCGAEPEVRAWEVSSGRLRGTFRGHTREVEAIAVSPNAPHFASASSDGTVRIWDLDSQELVRVLTGHTDRVMDVQYSPSGAYLVSGGLDQTVRVFRAADGVNVQTDRHLDAICSVMFRGDHRQWLATDRGGSARIWQLRKGDPESSEASVPSDGGSPPISGWKAHEGRAWEVISRNGNEILTAGDDGKIRYWGTPTSPRDTVAVKRGRISDFAIHPDSQRLYLSSAARGLETWGFASQRREDVMSPDENGARPADALCILPNQTLVKAYRDGTILGVDLRTAQIQFRDKVDLGLDSERWDVDLGASAAGDRVSFASAAVDRTFLYSLPEGKRIREFGVERASSTAALAADGRRLGMLSDNCVVVWNTDFHQRIAAFESDCHGINALEFSPDGRYIAAGSTDRRIRLWDLVRPKNPPRTLDGHRGAVTAILFSPDQQLLVSGDDRGEIKFWFLREGAELLTIRTKESVRRLQFSRDGNHLVALGETEIQIFHSGPAELGLPTRELAGDPLLARE